MVIVGQQRGILLRSNVPPQMGDRLRRGDGGEVELFITEPTSRSTLESWDDCRVVFMPLWGRHHLFHGQIQAKKGSLQTKSQLFTQTNLLYNQKIIQRMIFQNLKLLQTQITFPKSLSDSETYTTGRLSATKHKIKRYKLKNWDRMSYLRISPPKNGIYACFVIK